MRPSWIEIDLDAIRHNVSVIVEAIAPTRLCAVVKADAYGHGDIPVAQAALSGGAEMLAVALVEEGVRLREAGISVPILLLSEPDCDDVSELEKWRLTPTVYRKDLVQALASATRKKMPVHVKIDTGMHRVGADIKTGIELVQLIDQHEILDLEGVWTHLAVSEEDDEFTRLQLDRFNTFVAEAHKVGVQPKALHVANTAGALAFSVARYDIARIGLGIYGLRPAPHIGFDLDLRPAMRLVSRISFVRSVSEGERVSYGRCRPMPSDGTLATVPIGYADGVHRRLFAAGGEVLIRGKRHPFAGNVTMDQIIVDSGGTPVEVGDEVVLIGRQGSGEISADQWAQWLGTISYEIVCSFGPRLPRRYRGES